MRIFMQRASGAAAAVFFATRRDARVRVQLTMLAKQIAGLRAAAEREVT
jgi:hypothetical protein